MSISRSPTAVQHVAMCQEVATSVKLIEAGLGHLQRIDGANDFYHLPILLLASGFERFMKTIVCLDALRRTGAYSPGDIKGHDLVPLLDRITAECFSDDYLQTVPAARSDIDYLRRDDRLRDLVRVLSDFGQTARYYELDTILGKTPSASSPDQMWSQVELAILTDDPDWAQKLRHDPGLRETYSAITSNLVKRLEMFARALSRLFTIGELGERAKVHTGTIGPFLYLRDTDLGTRKYWEDFTPKVR
jgi:hypothetical protein